MNNWFEHYTVDTSPKLNSTFNNVEIWKERKKEIVSQLESIWISPKFAPAYADYMARLGIRVETLTEEQASDITELVKERMKWQAVMQAANKERFSETA
jgi:phosphoserine phosphatase